MQLLIQPFKNPSTPKEVVAGFDKRVEAMFRAESGKPLVREEKKEPLGPGRGNYVRGYSYSMVGFAARCLYLNEMLDEANAALAENAQHYQVFESPLLNADWNSGIVTITKGERKMVLNFESGNSAQGQSPR